MDNTNNIGTTVLKIVEILHDTELLTERLHGAQHPQSIHEYDAQLRDKNTQLAELKHQLKEMRLAELLHYQEKLTRLGREIEITTELMDEHDLRELSKEVMEKIETIQKAIANEN